MSLIHAPDPAWPVQAETEAARWRAAVPGLVTVHHIGSTSVPGLPAKPILDLIPVFADDAAADAAQGAVEAMGYEWMGAFGLPGRRYARLFDPLTGARRVHAHSYVQGHPDIRRHLAFRDALRGNAALRAGYAAIKGACAARHPDGGADYGACKSEWIAKAEARALETAP
ncbi:GrpB family protein [Sulfitobacter albidus]|uniref:GrpB family protein n=1 Tax=Sulfitobacter albidus TaxID=2829501 RepID=A0A975JFY3_9RHOB|nr:GrpB family protein [Sulfitobacter albidus]QUJ77545.1 GrpB family protein [Sulfitobacter albidus]